ncbi:hypothetical protein HYH03_004340 [Edaphochlamys debaryana]|uniref:AP2/ERF domain-containing protein n=1 Tax=Edaphochlamys debaryana TaxID=47281 RepID=A0A835Y9H3_9CHLO|nr:hypothetical protein HYH03_004340 [Edaphochlamys debaryana]|eukprot:KAG2497594.1 hypothetical protein HYH03_004340 [Edaphochlamys debaryana]
MEQQAGRGHPVRSALPAAPAHRAPYRGVVFNRATALFQAGIAAHNRSIGLGAFETDDEAARIYDKAALRIRGLRAATNFPLSDYVLPSGAFVLDLQVEALLLEAFLSPPQGADATQQGPDTMAASAEVVRQCLARINGADPNDLQEAAEALGEGYLRLMNLIADAADLLANVGGVAAGRPQQQQQQQQPHSQQHASGLGPGTGHPGDGPGSRADGAPGPAAALPEAMAGRSGAVGPEAADRDALLMPLSGAQAGLGAGKLQPPPQWRASAPGAPPPRPTAFGTAAGPGMALDEPPASLPPRAASGADRQRPGGPSSGGAAAADAWVGPPQERQERLAPPEQAAGAGPGRAAGSAPGPPPGSGAGSGAAGLPAIPNVATPAFLPPNFMNHLCTLLAAHMQQLAAAEPPPPPRAGGAATPPPPIVTAVKQLQQFGFPLQLLTQAAAHLATTGVVPPAHLQALGAAPQAGPAAPPPPAAAGSGAARGKRKASEPGLPGGAGEPGSRMDGPEPPAAKRMGRDRGDDSSSMGLEGPLDVGAIALMAAAANSGIPLAATGGIKAEQAAAVTAAAAAANAAAAMTSTALPASLGQLPTAATAPPSLAPSAAPSRITGGGGGHLGLGRRLFSAISAQLPAGWELDCLLPPRHGFLGVLYTSPNSTQVGGALWDGGSVHNLGTYSSDRDARQSLNSTARLLSGSNMPPPAPVPPPPAPAPLPPAPAAPGPGRGAMQGPPPSFRPGAVPRAGLSYNSAAIFASNGGTHDTDVSGGIEGGVAPGLGRAAEGGGGVGGHTLPLGRPTPTHSGSASEGGGARFGKGGGVGLGGRSMAHLTHVQPQSQPPQKRPLAAPAGGGGSGATAAGGAAAAAGARGGAAEGGSGDARGGALKGVSGPVLAAPPERLRDGGLNLLCQLIVQQAEPLSSDEVNNIIAHSLTPAALQSLLDPRQNPAAARAIAQPQGWGSGAGATAAAAAAAAAAANAPPPAARRSPPPPPLLQPAQSGGGVFRTAAVAGGAILPPPPPLQPLLTTASSLGFGAVGGLLAPAGSVTSAAALGSGSGGGGGGGGSGTAVPGRDRTPLAAPPSPPPAGVAAGTGGAARPHTSAPAGELPSGAPAAVDRGSGRLPGGVAGAPAVPPTRPPPPLQPVGDLAGEGSDDGPSPAMLAQLAQTAAAEARLRDANADGGGGGSTGSIAAEAGADAEAAAGPADGDAGPDPMDEDGRSGGGEAASGPDGATPATENASCDAGGGSGGGGGHAPSASPPPSAGSAGAAVGQTDAKCGSPPLPTGTAAPGSAKPQTLPAAVRVGSGGSSQQTAKATVGDNVPGVSPSGRDGAPHAGGGEEQPAASGPLRGTLGSAIDGSGDGDGDGVGSHTRIGAADDAAAAASPSPCADASGGGGGGVTREFAAVTRLVGMGLREALALRQACAQEPGRSGDL